MRVITTKQELLPFLDPKENSNVEYKARVTPSRGEGLSKMAKSIASFANGLGGIIVVGAKDKTGEPAPLSAADADAFQKGFDHAQLYYCRPSPFIVVKQVPWDDGFLLVVHVQAQGTTLVGSRWLTENEHPNDDPSWIFPRRVGRDTQMITPENLPVYMDPRLRRSIVQLNQLIVVTAGKKDHEVFLSYREPSSQVVDTTRIASMKVEESANVFSFVLADVIYKTWPLRVPLDDVETVWEGKDKVWFVRLTGFLAPGVHGNEHEPRYRSRVSGGH